MDLKNLIFYSVVKYQKVCTSFAREFFMKIDITLQQSCSDHKISHKIAQQARLALSRFAPTIQTVTIRITDANGPKGGIDIRCVVLMKLISTGEVVVHGEGENVFSALNQCLARADRAISRSLDRRRNTPIRVNRRRMTSEDESLLTEYEH